MYHWCACLPFKNLPHKAKHLGGSTKFAVPEQALGGIPLSMEEMNSHVLVLSESVKSHTLKSLISLNCLFFSLSLAAESSGG